MKRARLFCLASMAMLTVALAGSSAVSATALCEDEPVEGQCGVAYESGTEFTGKGSSVEIQNSLSNIVCKESTIQGKTSEEPTGEGEALKSSVTALTFSGCEMKGGLACTVATESLPYGVSLSWTEKGNGSLSFGKGEKGIPKGKAVCGGLFNCTFSGEPVLQLLGGNPAKIVASKVALTVEGGFLCPKSAFLNASYTLNQPSGGEVFVASFSRRQTVFCDELVQLCPLMNQYEENFAYELELFEPSVFEYVYNAANKTIACPESTLAVQNFARGAPLKAVTFGGTPTFPLASCSICNVIPLQMPFEMKVEAGPVGMVDGDGEVKLLSLTEGPPEFDIACGGVHCFYEAKEAGMAKDEVIGSFYGGEPATVEFFDTLEKVAGSEALCGPTMDWFALYEITNPEGLPIYATRR